MLGLMGAATLEPEPIPLSVRIILVGDRMLYYLLAQHDPDFLTLFKVAADFEDSVERNRATELGFAGVIATLGRDKELAPVDRAG